MEDLHTPRFTQPEVLRVTKVKPVLLQTWLARGALVLTQQHPGSGRRRLYSPLDVVRVAVMRRLADFRIDLSVSKSIADACVDELDKQGSIAWEEVVEHRMHEATEPPPYQLRVAARAGYSPLAALGSKRHDWVEVRLTEILEPPFGTDFEARRTSPSNIAGLRQGYDHLGKLHPEVRAEMARQGIHAEPVLLIPVGEIVNGTLLQLVALVEDEGTGE